MRADDRVPLGGTGLSVTRLGLGLASIGGLFEPVDDEQAAATVDAAWDCGVRVFDTAPVYGYGRSEIRAGRALRDRPRDEYVLCTKVGRLIVAGGADTQPIWADPPPGVGPRLDYSYAGVMRSFEDSLARLGTGRIDVLHVLDPDLDFGAAVTGAYRAVAELRANGLIRAVSIGVNHADVAARFIREAPGPLDAVLLAGRYTLFDQSGLQDLLPLCRERGIAVLAAGVFQSGLLAAPRPGPGYGYAEVPAAVLERAHALSGVCARHDVPPLAAAIQFALGHPAVAGVVVGARQPGEVAHNAALLAHVIPARLWEDLKAAGLLPGDAPVPAAPG
jgi:D-threo-aldose 1-dehydrogenase